jgi:hypothetical protein
MHPLYQRLRELDWDSFQRFAEQLLSEKHPGLSIKHVEGSGGDKGLDLFEGALSGGSTIWQCKHFPNGLKAKQRPQILKSLNDAIDNFKPERWILVLSIDFDTSAHEWFQKVQAKYAAKTSIGQFLASDIVRELIHRRKLRDAFFPGAVLDTITVRRSLEGLGTMDQKALDDLSAKNLDEQIARLEEFDARFDYRISYAPNGGADIVDAADLIQRLEAAGDGEPVPVQFNVSVVHGYRAPEWEPGLYFRPIDPGEQTSSNSGENGMASPE